MVILVVHPSCKVRNATLIAALSALLAADAGANPAPDGPKALQQRLETLAVDTRLGGARVGLIVMASDSDDVIAHIAADEPASVASTAKLFTSAAALSLLGPAFRLRTALYGPERKGGTVAGDLYLKGYGDPSLRERDLWNMARQLHRAGVRTIRGRLVIDESYFDDKKLPPLYETRDTDAYYRPASGALSLDDNVVTVVVQPETRPGRRAKVIIAPSSSYVRLANRVTTVRAGRRSEVEVRSYAEGKRTIVAATGRIAAGHRGRRFRRRIDDPGLFVGRALLDLLAREGIRVAHKRIGRGAVPADARPIVVHSSPPLAQLIGRMNKASSNLSAEQLLKVMGAEMAQPPGTWNKGLTAVTGFLASVGFAEGSYQLKNGSGLYESGRFTPRQVAILLRQAYRDSRYGAEFVASLAVAGVDGTLTHRFAGSEARGYVRAKTGTLATVVTLSGYAGSRARSFLWCFSILINDLPAGRVARARRVADEMVQAIVSLRDTPTPPKAAP